MAIEYNQSSYSSSPGILAFPDHYVAVPQMLPHNSPLATVVGDKKIVKAGTFFPSNGASTVGIILNDVDVTNGDRQAALLIHGFVKTAALPVAPDPAIPLSVLGRLIMLPVTGALLLGGVTYDGNGSTGGAVPTDVTVYKYGEEITVAANTGSLVVSGKAFVGWSTSPSSTAPMFLPGSKIPFVFSITLYAIWVTAFNVTYDDGEGGGTVPTDTVEYAPGTFATVKAPTSVTAPAGEAFVSWNTVANGSGTDYQAGDLVPIVAADVVLYAQFETAYNLIYDAGAGSGVVPTDLGEYLVGDSATVKNNGAIVDPAGYVFSGWNTESDGSGTSYAPSSTITFATAADITLYAQFVASI